MLVAELEHLAEDRDVATGEPREQLERRPEEVIRMAVRGMLPKNSLGRKQLLKMKVYAGPNHPHEAQSPEPLRLERKVIA